MRSIKIIALLIGLGVMVAIYGLLGSGALGTGDRQPDATIPGPAGGSRYSPSAATTGTSRNEAAAGQQGARGKASNSAQPNASQAGSEAGAAQAASARPNNAPPLLLVSPANVVPLNVVMASGQGFQAGEEVNVSVDLAGATPDAPVRTATVDKDGNFYGVPITVTVGTLMGTHTVTARGSNSRRQAEAAFQVAGGTPYAEPGAYSGKGGSVVSLDGGGFRPNEVVSLHFDSLAVDPLRQVIAGPEGAVAISATLPLADPGEHAFLLVGEQSSMPLRIPFSVVGFSPWLEPSSYSPLPQQRLGFAGHDFAPGEEVRIFRERLGEHPVAVTHAGNDGEFQLAEAYELPDDAVGKNRFLATGLHSRTVVLATVDVLPFSPNLELSVYAGRPGTAVTFKGSGYAHNETIAAYLGGPKSGREVVKFQAGNDGTFEGAGAFAIPTDITAGSITVSAVGERSRATREITFALLPLTPWAGLTQYAGPPGTTFTFEGHDFLPGETVTIHLGDRQSPAFGTVQADANGAFHGGGTYTVPDAAEGKITFLTVGETSNTDATAAFTVTAGGGEERVDPTPVPKEGAGEQ